MKVYNMRYTAKNIKFVKGMLFCVKDKIVAFNVSFSNNVVSMYNRLCRRFN